MDLFFLLPANNFCVGVEGNPAIKYICTYMLKKANIFWMKNIVVIYLRTSYRLIFINKDQWPPFAKPENHDDNECRLQWNPDHRLWNFTSVNILASRAIYIYCTYFYHCTKMGLTSCSSSSRSKHLKDLMYFHLKDTLKN